jgi:hypothetical protein
LLPKVLNCLIHHTLRLKFSPSESGASQASRDANARQQPMPASLIILIICLLHSIIMPQLIV